MRNFETTENPLNLEDHNVRNGPEIGYRIVGPLGDGPRVHKLRCESHGNSRWCEIEMTTDMREHGWVNARYLGH